MRKSIALNARGRFQGKIRPCLRCGHGSGIHHRYMKQKSYPCHHPGCKCKEYAAPKR